MHIMDYTIGLIYQSQIVCLEVVSPLIQALIVENNPS